VAQLAERCVQFDADFAAHVTSGRLLDQYYIPTRYPDALAPAAVPFASYTQAKRYLTWYRSDSLQCSVP
jgi:hypothetical protein